MKLKDLDPHTFGGSKASENLVTILNTEFRSLRTSVGRTYHKYTSILSSLKLSKDNFDNGNLATIIEIYYNYIINHIKLKKYPPKVESHLLCAIKIAYKKSFQ